jgi:hypothetical protein
MLSLVLDVDLLSWSTHRSGGRASGEMVSAAQSFRLTRRPLPLAPTPRPARKSPRADDGLLALPVRGSREGLQGNAWMVTRLVEGIPGIGG